MEKFTNFLTVLTTILLFAMWMFPMWMFYGGYDGNIGILYIPIVIITIAWGRIIYEKYYK